MLYLSKVSPYKIARRFYVKLQKKLFSHLFKLSSLNFYYGIEETNVFQSMWITL